MNEGKRADVTDGLVWHCKQCKTTKSIREGSFFSKSRIPLKKWLLIMYMLAREYPVTDVAEEANVEENTAVAVFRWLREVSSTKLLQYV